MPGIYSALQSVPCCSHSADGRPPPRLSTSFCAQWSLAGQRCQKFPARSRTGTRKKICAGCSNCCESHSNLYAQIHIEMLCAVAAAENAARHSARRSRIAVSEIHHLWEVFVGLDGIAFGIPAVDSHHRPQVDWFISNRIGIVLQSNWISLQVEDDWRFFPAAGRSSSPVMERNHTH